MPKIFNYIILNRRAIKGKFLPIKLTSFCKRISLLNTTPLSPQQPLTMTSCQKPKWIFWVWSNNLPLTQITEGQMTQLCPTKDRFWQGPWKKKRNLTYLSSSFEGKHPTKSKTDHCWPSIHNCATIIPLTSLAIQIQCCLYNRHGNTVNSSRFQ